MKDIKLSESDINKYYTTSTVKTTLNVTNMTVVNGIVGNKAADGIYNLNGQKLEVIQRGINITEGKKILVK